MLKKSLLLGLLALLALLSAKAQQSSKDAVTGAIKKLMANYEALPYLSFEMNYYYAAEDNPAVYIDSLKGNFKIHGKTYWYSIDSTESVTMDTLTLVLFKEDKIMYLSKPSASAQFANPSLLLDSILLNDKDIHCSLQEGEEEQTLLIEFTPGRMYKRIEYHINKRSGLIESMKSWVQSAQLYDPSVRDALTTTDTYAIIDVFFTNYRKDRFDTAVFDITRYFKRAGKEYISLPPYDAYKIFLGTPSL